MSEALTLQYIPLAQARRWDRNPKRHDIGAICRSIELHGFRDPPAYDAALDAFVEGNGRTDALEALWQQKREPPRGIAVLDDGGWALPVIFGVDARSRAAAEAYGVDHNNLTLSGGDFTAWDMAKLWNQEEYTSLLSELATADVMPVSVDGDDLDALLGGFVQEGAGGDDFDATPEDGPTRTQAGELWVIGGVHRLIVGDSTDPATVARLMGGKKPTATITDPPYGISASSMTMGSGESAKPKAARLSYRQEWDSERPDISHLPGVAEYLCVWGGNYFTDVLPPTNHWLCWHKKNDGLSFSEFEMAWTNYGKQARHLSHHWGGEEKEHITQKPLEVMLFSIAHCPDASLIFDPYAGVGTTLVAAHRTGNRAYLAEIAPRYADVILRRAEAEGLTCEKAE